MKHKRILMALAGALSPLGEAAARGNIGVATLASLPDFGGLSVPTDLAATTWFTCHALARSRA